MSVMDKIINAMKFNDDPYDNENEDPGYDTGYEDDTPQSSNADYEKEDELEMEELENTSVPRSTRRRSMGDAAPANRPTVKRQYSESGMEVCIVKPTSVNDASEVTDLILQGSTVVLNLEGLDVDIAQRIIDFTSGSCYAVQGNVMKISHYIFVITPANIGVSGDISTSTRDGLDHTPGSSLNMPFGR